MKFKSLKTKLLFWFANTTFIVLLVFSFSFYFILKNTIYSNIETKLSKESLYIQNNFEKFKNSIEKDDFISSNVGIFKDKKLLSKNENFKLEDVKSNLNSKKVFMLIDNNENLQAINILKYKEYTIVSYQKDIDNKLEHIIDTMLLVEPILFLILLFLANKTLDKILIPINNLTKTTNEITIKNFQETIPLEKENNELSKLTQSFNTMINRLQEGVEKLDRFNSDVSHELKTPLTVIKGEIELSLMKDRPKEYYQESLQTINFEINQMEKIINNLLLLTKYTKTNITKTFETIHLDAILLNIIYNYDKQLKNKNIDLKIKTIENIKMNANQVLIESIFSNLIDNAIKYSPKNTNITISLFKDEYDEKLHFIIEDEGIGIKKEELPYITDKFYRIDDSRSKKIDGFGLGLSIVKNGIELHNGELLVDSEINIGTKIEVIF